MELEITKEQFDLIQNEVIRLEEQKPFVLEGGDPWEWMHINERIDDLKLVLNNERVNV